MSVYPKREPRTASRQRRNRQQPTAGLSRHRKPVYPESLLSEVHMPIGRALRVAALVAIGSATLIAQTDKPRTPKKGDTVVIEGCLRGSAVESAELMAVDAEDQTRRVDEVPSLTYRLTGDKKMLKALKEKHDRKVVTVKGTLQSDLAHGGLGTSVGRTRITFGLDPNNSRNDRPVPVLEAISYEGSSVSCAR
jgi:hypothetical protein